MEKLINSKRYFLYSALSCELKKIYFDQIYKFLGKLVFEYQGFTNWYQGLFTASFELKLNRDIIICEEQLAIVGVAILKNEYNEKKICTLRVAKEYQRQGIGHNLVEMSFAYLNTEKPMITLHKSKLHQFENLLSYYNFQLEQTQKHYYNIFSTELVFNGMLPEKDFIFNKIELMDMEKLYKELILGGKCKFEDFFDMCIRYWYQKERVRRASMLES